MFCSSCGRTLLAGETQCKHCGAPVGESIFTGIPYTSAQKKLLPGEEIQTGMRAYTHIDYAEPEQPDVNASAETGAEEPEAAAPVSQAEARDAQAETPAEEIPAADVPEEPKQVEAREDTMAEVAAELGEDLSDLKARPIASRGQSGISSDVSEYMQKLDNTVRRRANRKKNRAEAQEAADTAAEAHTGKTAIYGDADDEQDEDDEIDERRQLSARAVQAIKIIALLAVLAAVIVGIFFWVRHVRESTKGAPIDGVSLELYETGLQTITQHADSEYVQGLLDLYTSDGILTLNQRLEADANAISALAPAEASISDSQFINAMKSIQSNIGNAVTMDALAIAQPAEDSVATSESRWRVINASIEQLKAATSTQQLEAIINGERIAITTVAPTVTPAPVQYNTLTRGDKNDEVRQMQERLWQLGFLQDVRDGNFGGNTYTAVKAFQQAAGLDVTGIADSKTLTTLYSDDAPTTQYAQTGTTPTATAEAGSGN